MWFQPDDVVTLLEMIKTNLKRSIVLKEILYEKQRVGNQFHHFEVVYLLLNMVDANIYSQLTYPIYDWRILVNATLNLENKFLYNVEYIIQVKTNEGGKSKMECGLVSSKKCENIHSLVFYKPIYLIILAQGGCKLETKVILLSDPSSDSLLSFF